MRKINVRIQSFLILTSLNYKSSQLNLLTKLQWHSWSRHSVSSEARGRLKRKRRQNFLEKRKYRPEMTQGQNRHKKIDQEHKDLSLHCAACFLGIWMEIEKAGHISLLNIGSLPFLGIPLQSLLGKMLLFPWLDRHHLYFSRCEWTVSWKEKLHTSGPTESPWMNQRSEWIGENILCQNWTSRSSRSIWFQQEQLFLI